ncbi:MAG: hypothetical protein J6A36_05690 [Clostridia bacterium]|nr:hypothetical protein [Clostridia bacterium]
MEVDGGGGAGAGIGGNGGNGGESNSTCGARDEYNLWGHSYTDGGHDGYAGEDCGYVNIYNTLKVYAYGGAGSNTVPSLNYGTNSGGSGYPAAGIGGGGAGGAGGDWANGAGGYVGTWGDTGDCYRTNGNNGISLLRSDFSDIGVSGVSDGSYRGSGDDAASYFTYGVQNIIQYQSGTNIKITKPYVGGQGGVFYTGNGYFPSGSGGKAGNGGNIKVSSQAQVYAYNGDRITNADYTTPIYDYDKDGNKLSTTCYVLTKYNTTQKTSPLKIFAQSGILRNVYYNNLDWGRKPTTGWDYFYEIFGNQLEESVKDIIRPTNYNEVENHLIRRERTIELTGYTNPETHDCYGIGSGAGYMEVSNGTYKVEASMN